MRLLTIFRTIFPRQITGNVARQTIILDGCEIRDAQIVNCILHYGGGRLVMENVRMHGCNWNAHGAAANTLEVVKMIAATDPDYIRKTFGLGGAYK